MVLTRFSIRSLKRAAEERPLDFAPFVLGRNARADDDAEARFLIFVVNLPASALVGREGLGGGYSSRRTKTTACRRHRKSTACSRTRLTLKCQFCRKSSAALA